MNSNWEFKETEIEGCFEIVSFVREDIRGSFIKDYSNEIFAKNGIAYNIQETFYAINKKGVIRGLHFQREMMQSKLVRCITGQIYDVVVDLRINSKTFKKWIAFELYGENQLNTNTAKPISILVPVGCAHGYLSVEPSMISYQCAQKFYEEYDDGIIYNDPDIGVFWPIESIDGEVILSDKDKQLQSFEAFHKRYGGL